MPEQIWDAKPDEGEPRLIEVGNPTEAIKADPERYSRAKPEPKPVPPPAFKPAVKPKPADKDDGPK